MRLTWQAAHSIWALGGVSEIAVFDNYLHPVAGKRVSDRERIARDAASLCDRNHSLTQPLLLG